MSNELKARAIRTIYHLIELSNGHIAPDDILELGMFFGSIDRPQTMDPQELLRLVTDACYLLNSEADMSPMEYETWRQRWLKSAEAVLTTTHVEGETTTA